MSGQGSGLWTTPTGGIFDKNKWVTKRPYGMECKERGVLTMKKVDDHKYVTEAKDLPIETCVSMWIIKYGDGEVAAMETAEQDALMWEIGNRLWWANRLQHNKPEDTYEIID